MALIIDADAETDFNALKKLQTLLKETKISSERTKFYGVDPKVDYSHENKLKTILPLSAMKYSLDNKCEIPYIKYDQENGEFITGKLNWENFNLTGELCTEKKITDEICINFPPHDIVINNEKDFESKVCIFPCKNTKKLFETIIRQNNIACCIQNIVNSSPDINSITDNFTQKPYILLCLYNSEGLKPIVLSNKALIYMCRKSSSNSKSKRADIICNYMDSMLEEYSHIKKITYKEGKADTVPHQKITLYLTDYVPNLKETTDKIQYIKYSEIIEGCVYKTRNICDYINVSSYKKRIDDLELENKLLKLKLQEQ